MRKRMLQRLLSVLLLAPMLWAAKADKADKEAKKYDKELKRVSLMAADKDGRRVVSRVVAKQLGVSRKQLVDERRETGLDYGHLFGAHEVAKSSGLTFGQVVEQMKQQHTLPEISREHQLDLKAILSSAKKLNGEIDRQLDRVGSFDKDEMAKDRADSYDPTQDSVPADTSSFRPSDIAQAAYQVHHRGLPPGIGGEEGEEGGEEGGPQTGGGRGRGPR